MFQESKRMLTWNGKEINLYQRELRDRDRQGLYQQIFASGPQWSLEEKVNILRPGMIKRLCHLFYLLGLTNLDHHSEI
jgi:hypothetical protein